VKPAIQEKLISRNGSADGTLVRTNASVPIEVAMDPEEYKKRVRSSDEEEKQDRQGPVDPGNPMVDFRGERRGNKTHRLVTDPDCRFVSKGSSRTGVYPGYTVNALMENRSRILLGFEVNFSEKPKSFMAYGVSDGRRPSLPFGREIAGSVESASYFDRAMSFICRHEAEYLEGEQTANKSLEQSP
jgi:hypothetical protein